MEKIVIVCGTNRNESVSLQIAEIYKDLLHSLGQDSELIDLRQLPPDFAFTALYENAGSNPDFNEYREMMARADKFVFIVPEYNGSFPGILKTFIDGLKYPVTFRDKKCALVGLSSGMQGAGLALSHLTDIFHYCGTTVLALKPKFGNIGTNFEEGKIVNKLYRDLLKEQAQKLIMF
jgi:chromate reductase, NAD(P)H dehydrogenase (quinone)